MTSEISSPLEQLEKVLRGALRIPSMPFPDPGAHSWQAYSQAVHSAYCAVRFKVIDAIAEVEKARAAPSHPPASAVKGEVRPLNNEEVFDLWDEANTDTPSPERTPLSAIPFVEIQRKFCEVNGLTLKDTK